MLARYVETNNIIYLLAGVKSQLDPAWQARKLVQLLLANKSPSCIIYYCVCGNDSQRCVWAVWVIRN